MSITNSLRRMQFAEGAVVRHSGGQGRAQSASAEIFLFSRRALKWQTDGSKRYAAQDRPAFRGAQ